MLVPLSWLCDFAPIDAEVDTLASTLAELGLVVEGVERVGGDLDGVVVARVLALRPHPAADRVQLVDVDAGDGSALQIACGAFNMGVGDLVPLASVGTRMPGGMEIGRRKLRGEWSNGMLCSASELGLPEHEHGILVLAEGLAAPGTPLAGALGLEPDVVFDLDITPNRPDALSIAGVARDLAAGLRIPFSLPVAQVPVDAGVGVASVVVADPELSPRFTGTVVAGVRVGPSPAWLARRLTLCGMRAINNVVDASNYVMLELGQPNHAYDLDRLPGRGLSVRWARTGERIVTLDGVERTLQGDDGLICDASSTPVGIAGIMGGASSEISDATATVLFEAAYFTPMAIARTGKRLGLHSEARARFERGIDPEATLASVARFVELLPGTRRGPTTDARSDEHLPARPRVALRTARVNAVLGTALGDADIAGLLAPIGFAAGAGGEAGVQVVTVPSWRPDSDREIDVIEEVARLHGYRHIARTLPGGVRVGTGLTPYQRRRRLLRDVLVGAGTSEAWTTTFLAPGDLERAGLPGAAVEVENPLDRSESLLRTSLLPGLLKAVRFNADRQQPDVRLFEVGRVFEPPGAEQVLPTEREEVGCIVAGRDADAVLATRLWAVVAGGLRLAEVTVEPAPIAGLHPGRSARLLAGGVEIGVVGEVSPEVAAAYGLHGRVGWWSAELDALLTRAPTRPERAVPLSRFPGSDIDLAFVVADAVPAATVGALLREAGRELVESVALFDVYRGQGVPPGSRSLAYHLRLRAHDRTLTDAEVAEVRRCCIEAAQSSAGAVLRG